MGSCVNLKLTIPNRQLVIDAHPGREWTSSITVNPASSFPSTAGLSPRGALPIRSFRQSSVVIDDPAQRQAAPQVLHTILSLTPALSCTKWSPLASRHTVRPVRPGPARSLCSRRSSRACGGPREPVSGVGQAARSRRLRALHGRPPYSPSAGPRPRSGSTASSPPASGGVRWPLLDASSSVRQGDPSRVRRAVRPRSVLTARDLRTRWPRAAAGRCCARAAALR